MDNNIRNKKNTKIQKSIAALVLLATALSALDAWTADYEEDDPGNFGMIDGIPTPRGVTVYYDSESIWQQRQLGGGGDADEKNEPPKMKEKFSICGRDTDTTTNNALTPDILTLQQEQYATCPEYKTSTPILVLEGYLTYGRTLNQMRSFLLAVQYARDNGIELGVMEHSWAADVLFGFFMASDGKGEQQEGGGGDGGDNDAHWTARVEKEMCVKIIRDPKELEGREVVSKTAIQLFYYYSPTSTEEYMASRTSILRTLFQHYNNGVGIDHEGNQVGDMCSGIDSLFLGQEEEEAEGKAKDEEKKDDPRSTAVYSVIHLRYMEGQAGLKSLGRVSASTGCDPQAALQMKPDYIKSILAPLDMLKHPIVVITDGQNGSALKRLKADPDIGPMIKFVPKEAAWLGGDMTLAIMADVFIGNPASTVSGFIAQSRVALGFSDNYMYRTKKTDESNTGSGEEEWITVCGDECLFRKKKSKNKKKAWQMSDKRIGKKLAAKQGGKITAGQMRKYKLY
ncbi:hypothetical protein ACHAXR_007672 [Thalassiosira sp. AJA248-18]